MNSKKISRLAFAISYLKVSTSRIRFRLQVISLFCLSVAIGFGQACSQGFQVAPDNGYLSSGSTTSENGPLPGGGSVPPNLDLNCKPDADPAVMPLRRMSKHQYNNTMVEIARGGLLTYSDRANETFRLLGSLAPVMGILPGDIREKNSFATLDQSLTEYHAFSYFFIASSTADFAVADVNWLNSYGGACLKVVAQGTAITDACLDAFIRKLGRTALRKKLDNEEFSLFKTIYQDFPNSKEGVAGIIQAMLLHPRFMFLVETDGTPVNGRSDLLQLNDFEIAQRLSFFFLGSTPSQQMLDDAEAGLFTASDESLKNQIAKYFKTSGNPYDGDFPYNYGNHAASQTLLQRNFSHFYDQWLEISRMPSLPEGAIAEVFKYVYSDPERYAWSHAVDTDPYLMGEAFNFVNRLTWFENKKFSDFLTDNSTVLQGGVAKFYNVPAVKGVTQLPDRSGYLTRAAFLVTGDDDTHPFSRGAFVRRNILCDQLPSPNPDALPDRALAPPEANPDWNNRERYAHKTAGTNCMACHSQINPLAFALEDFDALGRNRHGLFEPVFKVEVKSNGTEIVTVAGKPANNSNVSGIYLSATEVLPQVTGAIELSQQLAKSPKANMCFARQLFRHTFGRKEASGDACLLQDMYTNGVAADGSIKRMIFDLPLSKHFKLKKIGP